MTAETPIKFLILGISESGKSTVLKGMKLALQGSYTQEERLELREIIWTSILHDFQVILKSMESFIRSKSYARIILMQPGQIENTPNSKLVEAISALWLDREFQSAYKGGHEHLLNDSVKYYAKRIQSLMEPDYVPNDEDVLWASVRTCGITATSFSDSALLNGLKCSVLDVGGARSERKNGLRFFPTHQWFCSLLTPLHMPRCFSRTLL